MNDSVTQPKHYTSAGIECIDAIEAALGPDGFRAYCIGNVIKYNWRHKLKNGNEDLRKAKVYQAWAAAGTAGREAGSDRGEAVRQGTALLDRQFEAATAGPALNHAGGDIEE